MGGNSTDPAYGFSQIHQMLEPKQNKTDDLLREIVQELQGLRQDIKLAEIKRDPLYQAIIRSQAMPLPQPPEDTE